MTTPLTVLGLGNILCRDEGVGVRLMEAVRDSRPWGDEVRFVDGGAGGLNLLNVIEEAERLVVFDAADLGLSPGECRVLSPDQLAGAEDSAADRLSLHDVSFAETLDLCARFLRRPDVVTILAIQPATAEYGKELSQEILAAMPRLAARGAELVAHALAM